MYGIVNKAIEELVIARFGSEKWEAVKERSGVDVDYFVSIEPYDDDITFQLAHAVAEEMSLSIGEVLRLFGEWWVLHTAKTKYSGMMEAGGSSLMQFLKNLPQFHNRVMLIYPRLTPPEFSTSHIEDSSIWIHYRSKRDGLREFVFGLLSGLSIMYQTPATIELIQSRESGSDHEIFKVSWI
jgi:Haem-NO-binding